MTDAEFLNLYLCCTVWLALLCPAMFVVGMVVYEKLRELWREGD